MRQDRFQIQSKKFFQSRSTKKGLDLSDMAVISFSFSPSWFLQNADRFAGYNCLLHSAIHGRMEIASGSSCFVHRISNDNARIIRVRNEGGGGWFVLFLTLRRNLIHCRYCIQNRTIIRSRGCPIKRERIFHIILEQFPSYLRYQETFAIARHSQLTINGKYSPRKNTKILAQSGNKICTWIDFARVMWGGGRTEDWRSPHTTPTHKKK